MKSVKCSISFSKVIHGVLLWLSCWGPYCRRTVKRLSEILWATSKTVNHFQWTRRRQKYSLCSFCCYVSAHHQSYLLLSTETETAVVLGAGYASQKHKLLLVVDPLWQMAPTVQLSPFSILAKAVTIMSTCLSQKFSRLMLQRSNKKISITMTKVTKCQYFPWFYHLFYFFPEE